MNSFQIYLKHSFPHPLLELTQPSLPEKPQIPALSCDPYCLICAPPGVPLVSQGSMNPLVADLSPESSHSILCAHPVSEIRRERALVLRPGDDSWLRRVCAQLLWG